MKCFPPGFRERERERAVGPPLLREPLRQRQRLPATVLEEAEAGAKLLVVHGFGARGQRSGQPQRGPNHHEQHGQVEGPSTRLLVLCLKDLASSLITYKSTCIFL